MGVLVPDPTLYPQSTIYPSMTWPVTATAQRGGNKTRFDGDTLALNAHLARLLDEERQRVEDEALILLLCA